MKKPVLDKLFETRLKNLEKEPPTLTWEKMASLLDEQEEEVGRAIMPMPTAGKQRKSGGGWWSVAASVALLLCVGVWIGLPLQKNDSIANNRGLDSLQKKQTPQIVQDKQEREPLPNMPIEIEPKADNDKLNNSKESNNQTSKPDNKPENKPITPKKVKDLERKLEKSQEDLRLTKDFKKEMLVENQPKPERIEKPAESTEKKTHKITVTVKLSADNTNTLVADNAPKKPKTKVGKMLKTIKDVKNGELEPGEFKIFGRDADKMFASIGKD